MKANFKRILSIVLIVLMLVSVVSTGLVTTGATSVVSSDYLTNAALGKTVTMTHSGVVSNVQYYNASDVESGLTALTDGESTNANFWVNSEGNPYVSFNSSALAGPYSLTVDLGESRVVNSISLFNYARPYWSVSPAESVTYSVSVDGSSWETVGTVELADAIHNELTDSKYTGDDAKYDIYEFALTIDKTDARYVKAEFENNSAGRVNFGEFEVYCDKAVTNIAKGDTVTFSYGEVVSTANENYSVSYINNGLYVLTDGTTMNPNWWVNNGNPLIALWDDYVTGPYEFIVNLDALCAVNQVSANFYSRTDWGCGAPDDVTFYVSPDGKEWFEVGTVTASDAVKTEITDSRNPSEQQPTIYTYALDCDYVDMKYVKVAPSSNDLGYIACEEIQVYGYEKTIQNLALGLTGDTSKFTYEIAGGGSASEPQSSGYTVKQMENNSISRITDGMIVNSSSVTYESNWPYKTWNDTTTQKVKYMQLYANNSRTLTVDLGSVCNIAELNMHCAAMKDIWFYAPGQLTYFASEDGVNYYKLGMVSTGQAEEDANDSNISSSSSIIPAHYNYEISGLNVNARYIKVSFSVYTYMLIDEFIINGYSETNEYATQLTSYEAYNPEKEYIDTYASTEMSGGVKNEYVAYSGWYKNQYSGLYVTSFKQKKEYLSAIAYVDENGVAQDWMFDGIVVCGHHGASSGEGVYNSYLDSASTQTASMYADKGDWYEWLCYAFGKDTSGNDITCIDSAGNPVSLINLEALEAAAAQAKEDLNDPDYKVSVKLVINPAVHLQSNWGTLNGEKIDFTVSGAGSQAKALENRVKAYQWYVDTAIEMWEEANFEHLEFTGFYYYEEKMNEKEDPIAGQATFALSEIVHSHASPSTNTKEEFMTSEGGKLYFFQIPYFNAQCYYNWASYGFDYALYQPNYSFVDEYSENQLVRTANLCKFYGMGLEMEFGGMNDEYVELFPDYLDYGYSTGYVDAVLAWYMGTWGCWQLSTGVATSSYNSAHTRGIYDDMYDFVVYGRHDILGDVNSDKTLSVSDATRLQKQLARLVDLSVPQTKLADVNEDSKISIRDVTTIQMKIAKIIE